MHTQHNKDIIRVKNTRLILRLIRNHQPISRASLSKMSKLTRSTVSSIVSELLDNYFIYETEYQLSNLGRPGLLIKLNPNAGCSIGVEIGAEILNVILIDFTDKVLWQKRIFIPQEVKQPEYINQAEKVIDEAIKFAYTKKIRIFGIGVGITGIVNKINGELIFSPDLNWDKLLLYEKWMKTFRIPIFIDNNYNTSVMGEYYYGKSKGTQNLIYICIEVGIGAGIIINNKIYRGNCGFAGEIGHITIDPKGDLCVCGKYGCLETIIGTRFVENKVRKDLEKGVRSKVIEFADKKLENITFENIIMAANDGDPEMIIVVNKWVNTLGIVISNLITLLNPEVVVLGGILKEIDSALVYPIITEIISNHLITPLAQNIKIIRSIYGIDATAMGATALVLDNILHDPIFYSEMD